MSFVADTGNVAFGYQSDRAIAQRGVSRQLLSTRSVRDERSAGFGHSLRYACSLGRRFRPYRTVFLPPLVREGTCEIRTGARRSASLRSAAATGRVANPAQYSFQSSLSLGDENGRGGIRTRDREVRNLSPCPLGHTPRSRVRRGPQKVYVSTTADGSSVSCWSRWTSRRRRPSKRRRHPPPPRRGRTSPAIPLRSPLGRA